MLASSTHSVWNRFDAGSGISNDSWMSTNTWTNSSMTAGASGALYCDSDTGISSTANTNYAASASVTQATLGLTSTSTNVLMLWFKTTSTSATLASLSDGTSADRQLWVDASGYLRFSARSGNSATSWTSTATGALVNDGAWHFAVVSMTGYGSASGGATLYLDGASLTSVTGKATHVERAVVHRRRPSDDVPLEYDQRWGDRVVRRVRRRLDVDAYRSPDRDALQERRPVTPAQDGRA